MEQNELLDKLPQPPKDANFKLVGIKEISLPHPYCITPKHLKYNEGMILDVESAERKSKEMNPRDSRRWAVCGICKEPYSEHKKQMTLFIQVEDNSSREALNENEELRKYLVKLKPSLEKYGIDGIAFPNKMQAEREFENKDRIKT